jgi:hypothetical protein
VPSVYDESTFVCLFVCLFVYAFHFGHLKLAGELGGGAHHTTNPKGEYKYIIWNLA